jgi:hypothetical protein
VTYMLAQLATPERPWSEIPGVAVIGGIIGIVIVIAAIRAMMKGK